MSIGQINSLSIDLILVYHLHGRKNLLDPNSSPSFQATIVFISWDNQKYKLEKKTQNIKLRFQTVRGNEL